MTEPDNTVLLVDVMQMVTVLHRKAEDIADGDLLDRLSRFVAFERQALPLTRVDLDEWLVNPDVVTDYAARYAQTGECPPIVFDAVNGSIIDGMHRARALALAGAHAVPALVGTTRWLDPYWVAGEPDDEAECETECEAEYEAPAATHPASAPTSAPEL